MSDAPIIVWFTHDLRLSDHAALTKAADTGRPLLPVYVLDDDAPGDWPMGGASRWWLEQSLQSLASGIKDKGGRLLLRRGKTLDVLQKLAEEPPGRTGVTVSLNQDLDHVPVLVHGPPQVVPLTIDFHKNLIDMPLPSGKGA